MQEVKNELRQVRAAGEKREQIAERESERINKMVEAIGDGIDKERQDRQREI